MYYLIVLETVDDVVNVLRMFPNFQVSSFLYPAVDPAAMAPPAAVGDSDSTAGPVLPIAAVMMEAPPPPSSPPSPTADVAPVATTTPTASSS